MLERLVKAFDREIETVDKSRWNNLYYIVWADDGGGGTAWIETKLQLKMVLDRLKAQPNLSVTVETHMVPRDKSLQVPWLNGQGVRLKNPVLVMHHSSQCPETMLAGSKPPV